MVVTPIEYVDIPTVDDIDIGIEKNVNRFASNRRAKFYNYTLSGNNIVTLGTTPYNANWVEVWHDKWRVVNTDPLRPRYIVDGNQVILNDIYNGAVLIVVDTEPMPYYGASIIKVSNVQRDQYGLTSLFCEPVLMSQPENGYVRLSADRKSIAYVPFYQYVGTDTFLWTLITQHGQMGQAKCAKITVI
jgi:hypothetical protein